MSTPLDKETRYERFTLGAGMLGWLYEYECRVPRHRQGALASGLELGVQLDGEWQQRGSRAGAHIYTPGTIAPLSPGERYNLTVHAPSGRGSQIGFIVYPEEVPELAGDTGGLAVAEGLVRDARLAALALDLRRELARQPGEVAPAALLERQIRDELMRFVRAVCVLLPVSPVLEVKRYLDRNIATGLYVPHLAEMAGMSERSFLRRFKEEVGLSPTRYRLLLKLNEAARLTWAEPALTISRIAARVGFDDLPHFHRAFRAEFGMTPAAYGRRSAAR